MSQGDSSQQFDRALAGLQGLALGDALGMPTQNLTRAEIAARYGVVDRLLAGAVDQPIAPGRPAGSVTDDTDQALLLAQELIRGRGVIEPRSLAAALANWQREMIAAGSLDLLGPSTRRAIDLVDGGADPSTTGGSGTTNGAAMRVAPVGICCSPTDLGLLVDLVERSCLVTHHTGLAMAGAAAVAAAVSAGIDGSSIDGGLALGLEAADLAARRGSPPDGVGLTRRIRVAVELLGRVGDDEVVEVLDRDVGTSLDTEQSVVAALALASRFADDPMRALSSAASAGGDTDTMAAIAGAVLGAGHGTAAWPRALVGTVTQVNRLDLVDTVTKLLRLRNGDRLSDRSESSAGPG